MANRDLEVLPLSHGKGIPEAKKSTVQAQCRMIRLLYRSLTLASCVA